MSAEPTQFVDKRPNKLFFKHIIRKVFLEDWMVKLVALVVTLALWFGVTGLSTPTITRMSGVPLTLRFSNNTVVTNSPVQEVDIVISGDKRKIAQINKNDLVVSLDLTDVEPGDQLITLSPQNISVELPTGVKLDEVQPNKIAVRLEAVEEKEITVKAATEGAVPEGFEIYSETIVPQKVRVRGPSSYIKSLSSVSTEKIDLADKQADFTVTQIAISVANPKATPLDTVVDVTYRIGEKRIERTFVVPVKDEPGKKVTVVLFGGRSLFEEVKADAFQAEIVKNATGEDSPRIVLPEQMQNRVEIRKVRIN